MIRARWWPLIGREAGDMKAPRRRKRARKVFLGPEIILSGELTSCDTLVAEGTVDSRRIECRKFILRRAGFCKGVVQKPALRRMNFRHSIRRLNVGNSFSVELAFAKVWCKLRLQ